MVVAVLAGSLLEDGRTAWEVKPRALRLNKRSAGRVAGAPG
jgi:hypothetical protein